MTPPARQLGVGVVGADPTGRGFGARAHLPAGGRGDGVCPAAQNVGGRPPDEAPTATRPGRPRSGGGGRERPQAALLALAPLEGDPRRAGRGGMRPEARHERLAAAAERAGQAIGRRLALGRPPWTVRRAGQRPSLVYSPGRGLRPRAGGGLRRSLVPRPRGDAPARRVRCDQVPLHRGGGTAAGTAAIATGDRARPRRRGGGGRRGRHRATRGRRHGARGGDPLRAARRPA